MDQAQKILFEVTTAPMLSGFDAGYLGRPLKINPLDKRTDGWAIWNKGWAKGDELRRTLEAIRVICKWA